MANKKTLQITPAQPGWYAVFEEKDGTFTPASLPVPCWGLVETDDEIAGGKVQDVVGFWIDGDGLIQNLNEHGNHRTYAYAPDGDIETAMLRQGYVLTNRQSNCYKFDERDARNILKGGHG
jgi:hypothetical protein